MLQGSRHVGNTEYLVVIRLTKSKSSLTILSYVCLKLDLIYIIYYFRGRIYTGRWALSAVRVNSVFEARYCSKYFQCSFEIVCLNIFCFVLFYQSASIIIRSCLSGSLERIDTLGIICAPVMFCWCVSL